jgi:hypothetical protein
MQDIVIDPRWGFLDAVRAAWQRYSGGVMGMGYRTNVLRTWGNVVGRGRAVGGLDQFIEGSGSVVSAAKTLGMSASTLRRLRRYFESLHVHDTPADLQGVPTGALIDRALESGESDSVEFKETIPTQARDLAKELAAFATSGGGLVLIGVANDHTVVGFTDSRERAEGVVQMVNPTPRVHVELHRRKGKTICAMIVEQGEAPVYYVDHRPYVRDGTLSRPAKPDEVERLIRAKVTSDALDPIAAASMPTFERTDAAMTRLETAFQPQWRIKQASGDYVPNLAWRFRGPRFQMEWRQAGGARLQHTSITERFDLSQPLRTDELVAEDEIGLEILFSWRGKVRHELHRWPITRRTTPQKVLWDVGEETLPPLRWED